MINTRANVVHMYGFEPRVDLHKALSRVPGLSSGYRIIMPRQAISRLSQVDEWTQSPLEYFKLPIDWRSQPLFLVEPMYISELKELWQKVRMSFIEEHMGSVQELVIKIGLAQHYFVKEVVLYNGMVNAYL